MGEGNARPLLGHHHAGPHTGQVNASSLHTNTRQRAAQWAVCTIHSVVCLHFFLVLLRVRIRNIKEMNFLMFGVGCLLNLKYRVL